MSSGGREIKKLLSIEKRKRQVETELIVILGGDATKVVLGVVRDSEISDNSLKIIRSSVPQADRDLLLLRIYFQDGLKRRMDKLKKNIEEASAAVDQEREKNVSLLHLIFPPDIAKRLWLGMPCSVARCSLLVARNCCRIVTKRKTHNTGSTSLISSQESSLVHYTAPLHLIDPSVVTGVPNNNTMALGCDDYSFGLAYSHRGRSVFLCLHVFSGAENGKWMERGSGRYRSSILFKGRHSWQTDHWMDEVTETIRNQTDV